MIEIVSPGIENSRHGLRSFVGKAVELLQAGIHLLIVDLFPPSPRDPQGIHGAVWDEIMGGTKFLLPSDTPLTLVSYIGGGDLQAFIEPTAVGAVLPEMHLCLTPDVYIGVPLEATYLSAFEGMPEFWRGVLENSSAS